jgi:hypothetical protein
VDAFLETFGAGLGLGEIFSVDDVKVDRERQRYDVWISLRDRARLDCRRCGEESRRFYGL